MDAKLELSLKGELEAITAADRQRGKFMRVWFLVDLKDGRKLSLDMSREEARALQKFIEFALHEGGGTADKAFGEFARAS